MRGTSCVSFSEGGGKSPASFAEKYDVIACSALYIRYAVGVGAEGGVTYDRDPVPYISFMLLGSKRSGLSRNAELVGCSTDKAMIPFL